MPPLTTSAASTDARVSASAAQGEHWRDLAFAVIGAVLEPGEDAADRLAVLRQRFRGDLANEGDLAALVANAGLDGAEAEVLAVVAAAELDPLAPALLARLGALGSGGALTLGALRLFFPAPHVGPAALAPRSALRRSRLVQVTEGDRWSMSTVGLAPTVAWALVGDRGSWPGLPVGVTVAGDAAISAPPAAPLVLVTGDDRARRRALGVEQLGGGPVLVVPVPEDRASWDAVVCEATLSGTAVLVELDGPLPPEGRVAIGDADHLAWALTSRYELPLELLPDIGWTEVQAPSGEATAQEWADVFGPDTPRLHRLRAERLDAVRRALPGTGGDLERAVTRVATGRLDQLATRLRPRRMWHDLVLPEDDLDHLRELVSRYRHRSIVHDDWGFTPVPSAGLVAMFSGPSGTGKTLSAEVIASDLGLDLFTVSVDRLVSKYIGETEQNLEAVFTAAEGAEIVLFFDEADAIFGKRSEVSDARDRYANLEVSYLLQRLERYDGLVVLATNFGQNIDQAFLRRIDVSVEFALPNADDRLRLWRTCLPDRAPVAAGVDLEALADAFDLTGGSIRKSALQAAFLAAEPGSAIDDDLLRQAIRREYQKLGRLRPAV